MFRIVEEVTSLSSLYARAVDQLREFPCPHDEELALEAPALLELRFTRSRSTEVKADPSLVRRPLVPALDYSQTMDAALFKRVVDHYDRLLRRSGAIAQVVDQLSRTPQTKRAVVDLWKNRPGQITTEDPCLIYCWFRLTSDGLTMHAHFRGNDVCNKLLLNLDIMVMVQTIVASMLQVQPSWYRHYTDSLHLYRRDEARLADMLKARPPLSATR
jgi:hypothetical protein